MNCPKCGGELIINSEVCPNCDVIGEETPVIEAPKKSGFLKKHVKLFVLIICFLAVIATVIAVCVNLSRNKIHALNDGNRLNGTLVCETGKEFYYSDADTLYCSNKRFSSSEIIDTSNDGNISNIIEANGSIYYTKDNAIFQYNPKSRKKSAVCAAEGEYSVVAKSYYDIYYCHDDALYKFDTRTSQLVKIIEGIPVLSDNNLYLCENGAIYRTELDNLQKEKLSDVSEYTVPVFVKDGKLFCFNYKEPEIFSVSLNDGSIQREFNPQNYDNISDVTHINILHNYMFLRGENGIYRYDFDTGEVLFMTSVGFKEYINVYSSGLYAVSDGGDFCFSDFNGKIQFPNE